MLFIRNIGGGGPGWVDFMEGSELVLEWLHAGTAQYSLLSCQKDCLPWVRSDSSKRWAIHGQNLPTIETNAGDVQTVPHPDWTRLDMDRKLH